MQTTSAGNKTAPPMFVPAVSGDASTARRRAGVETSVAFAAAHHPVMMQFDGFAATASRVRGPIFAGRVDSQGRPIGPNRNRKPQ